MDGSIEPGGREWFWGLARHSPLLLHQLHFIPPAHPPATSLSTRPSPLEARYYLLNSSLTTTSEPSRPPREAKKQHATL